MRVGVTRLGVAEVEFGTPSVPVVSNVTAAPVTTAEEARETLAKQVVSPVLFERSLRWTLEQVGGDAAFVEPSPGRARPRPECPRVSNPLPHHRCVHRQCRQHDSHAPAHRHKLAYRPF